mgnify:CR=1 FL=1
MELDGSICVLALVEFAGPLLARETPILSLCAVEVPEDGSNLCRVLFLGSHARASDQYSLSHVAPVVVSFSFGKYAEPARHPLLTNCSHQIVTGSLG